MSEDTDTSIVMEAIKQSPNHHSVTIVSEDIDILVIITALGQQHRNIFLSKPARGLSCVQIYSSISCKHAETVVKNILFLDAIFGCDTIYAPFNVGKMHFINTLEKDCELANTVEVFSRKDADPRSLHFAGELFFVALYAARKLTHR